MYISDGQRDPGVEPCLYHREAMYKAPSLLSYLSRLVMSLASQYVLQNGTLPGLHEIE